MSKVGDYIYRDDKPIGKGTFGTVYTAYRNNHPETIYALKAIDLQELNDEDKKHCYEEAKWLRGIQHPNIVQYHDSFEHKNRFLVIIMEYCQKGSLKAYIRKTEAILEEECLEIVEQICSAVKFLHEQHRIHRDVKTDNIFLTMDKTVKLGDLALVRLVDNPSKLTSHCGSPLYMSPEMSDGKPYGYATDIWSLGCCIYQIATKESPFSARSEEELTRVISTETIRHKPFPYGEDIKILMGRMLRKDPTQRPTIYEVCDTIKSLKRKSPSPDLEEVSGIPPARLQNLSIAGASATFPGRTSNPLSDPYARPRSRRRHNPNGNRRHHSETSASSDDRGYSSYDAKDLDNDRQNEPKIVYIPVTLSPEECEMKVFADSQEKSLRKRMTNTEWRKMCSLLNDHCNKQHLTEEKFMAEMGQILGTEKYEKLERILKSYWTLKEPLLLKNFKWTQT